MLLDVLLFYCLTTLKEFTMLKNKKTYYQLILDKSGSMHDCVNTAINGFNEQMQMIRSLKKKYPKQEFVVSLTTFNQEVHFDINQENPDNIKELTTSNNFHDYKKNENRINYLPNGMTALYDAIGMSVNNILKFANEEINNDQATVVVVIITDGHENASIKYTYRQIQSMIKELELSDNWTFSYLSNTPDAVDYAMGMNIKKENAIRYKKATMKEDYDDIKLSMKSYFDSKENNIKKKEFIKSRRK